ncbi:hypothetical protein FN846DRAFT_993731 [Sphaerosporella brunnea]|uniref:Uncharacterized protein n=1 Tax=Sphaerosporella brunnea TaxID=1250544 RepID=A0A5J5ENR9_9PEZI|nr:hypothetical protein FN846DRAFT_993731 [Sphaerosporella brunnea]
MDSVDCSACAATFGGKAAVLRTDGHSTSLKNGLHASVHVNGRTISVLDALAELCVKPPKSDIVAISLRIRLPVLVATNDDSLKETQQAAGNMQATLLGTEFVVVADQLMSDVNKYRGQNDKWEIDDDMLENELIPGHSLLLENATQILVDPENCESWAETVKSVMSFFDCRKPEGEDAVLKRIVTVTAAANRNTIHPRATTISTRLPVSFFVHNNVDTLAARNYNPDRNHRNCYHGDRDPGN